MAGDTSGTSWFPKDARGHPASEIPLKWAHVTEMATGSMHSEGVVRSLQDTVRVWMHNRCVVVRLHSSPNAPRPMCRVVVHVVGLASAPDPIRVGW